MNSYQRRKREITYLTQRGEDLERLCFAMARRLGEVGASVPMAGGPVNGDSLLNDINAGDFTLRLAMAADAARPNYRYPDEATIEALRAPKETT